MYTAHIWCNNFQRFKPGPDVLHECFLGRKLWIHSDLLHKRKDQSVAYSINTNMAALQNVLLGLIGFMTSQALVGIHSIQIYLQLLSVGVEPAMYALGGLMCFRGPSKRNLVLSPLQQSILLQTCSCHPCLSCRYFWCLVHCMCKHIWCKRWDVNLILFTDKPAWVNKESFL
jgi:hypothetical protein